MAGTEVNMEAPIIKVEQRITVALVSKAAADLTATHERSKLSKTDIVNRAISLYEFLDKELGSGSCSAAAMGLPTWSNCADQGTGLG
jgi:hypothetical protein